MYVSETKLTARYAETDQMGIIHHSCYPVWFEAGRTDFIKKMGLPYSEIEKSGVLLPLIELRCFYKGFSRYEDEITVKTSVCQHNGIKTTFHYEVFKSGCDESITTGETIHAWVNRDFKPVNIKKYKPEINALIISAADLL
ncbi:MAG: acyl-CoA thioesterase [Ruminiclostridium sp.]|nr:acyl-CoA thioesterase [Ruminiclostridium sp.]